MKKLMSCERVSICGKNNLSICRAQGQSGDADIYRQTDIYHSCVLRAVTDKLQYKRHERACREHQSVAHSPYRIISAR